MFVIRSVRLDKYKLAPLENDQKRLNFFHQKMENLFIIKFQTVFFRQDFVKIFQVLNYFDIMLSASGCVYASGD